MRRRPDPPAQALRPLEGRKRVIVCGTRGFRDKEQAFHWLDRLLGGLRDPIILSGGARGADQLGEAYAAWNWLLLRVYRPEYGKHGRAAPLARNSEMAAEADACVAFWDGHSPGTGDMIRKARTAGLKLKVIRVNT